MRIVVVGGVAAGMSAANQARRRDPKCEVVVLHRGREISYSACGMPYNIGDAKRSLDDLVMLSAEAARTERGIDVRTRHEALAIDVSRRCVRALDLEHKREIELAWDKLVLATGAAAIRPKLPGLDLPGVFVLRELEDAHAIKHFLCEATVRRAIVVGAGYIGIEMADVLRGLGIEVTLLEKVDQVLPGFAPAIVEAAQQELGRHRVQVRTGTGLESIARVAADLVVRTDGTEIHGDLVIISVGVRPDAALARGAGLSLGESGAIAVDAGMRTSASDIYAAGDCVEAHHIVLDRPAWIPLGTTANKQGKVAGANAAGADERFGGIVGSAGFKLFDLEVARTGLGAAEIGRAGIDAICAVSKHHTRGRNYPGDKPITTVVFAERRTGRLLGAQMIGGDTVAKRIDVFATALHARMTLAQVEALDLTYAPPFAPVYDPILIAASVGTKGLAKSGAS
jgi:NADPH-dependent 2,4-dienoyl-CoA reductase/sulfur reductase-like enzyme